MLVKFYFYHRWHFELMHNFKHINLKVISYVNLREENVVTKYTNL